ncbi:MULTISPECIES: hypothetical protein [unclassified Bradyrhizobium]|uniref:hypothetical protein n=1 Tax=unclassified Bradyrhizobium TaxID=2631580 RepID=UPI00211E5A0F|nr:MULTISPECIES: hypothetical protein [unclassified Bradyrhizobium]
MLAVCSACQTAGSGLSLGNQAARSPRLKLTSMPISTKRLAELADLPESLIDTSDIGEADEAFFHLAKLRQPDGAPRAPKKLAGQDKSHPKG